MITGTELKQALVDAGVPEGVIRLRDGAYRLPKLQWVVGAFADAWENALESLKVSDWTPEKFDCDDFARLAAAFAGLMHATTEGAGAAGLAFGEFWYCIGGAANNEHAVVVFVTQEANGLQVWFWEPQLEERNGFRVARMEALKLTDIEVESCTECSI